MNTDILSEREERFDHVLSIFETVAENEERTEFNDALREMSILLREAAQDGDVMHAIRLERQCIALDQTRRPDRIDELNRQLLKSSAAEQGGALCDGRTSLQGAARKGIHPVMQALPFHLRQSRLTSFFRLSRCPSR